MLMKKISYLIATLFLVSCGGSSEQTKNETPAAETSAKTTITIKGSDTVLPLSQKQAEEYMKSHTDASITVVGGGSGVGMTALVENSTDIAMSSRQMKMEEKIEFKKKSVEPKEIIIAYDALAIIVNPKNKVENLKREQLEKIFTGAITNWKEVGGRDLKIVALSRETSSGTYEFFKEHVMDKKNYASTVLAMPATGAIVETVARTEGAIGYVGLAYISKDVKPVSVSYDEGKTFAAPSVASAQNGTYPVARPLYYYYVPEKETLVKPFVDYLLSEEGQKNVEEVGYVPLTK
ncbi:MAG: phosphate ABC transporter substrate-binding protein [Bacteroidota bacterium]